MKNKKIAKIEQNNNEENNKNGKKLIYLITGATSGLGVELIKKLIKENCQIRVIVKDNFLLNPEWRKLPSGVIPFVVDLNVLSDKSSKILRDACKNVDIVIHIAGASYNSKFTFNQLIERNVLATEKVLKTIIEVNKKKNIQFIFTSSVTVYGYRYGEQKITEETELHPSSHYSETKLMAEEVIKSFADVNPDIKYTILRLATFYGPAYEDPSFFKVFKLIEEKRMYYLGTMHNHLTFIHVSDVVDAILKVIDNKKAYNKIYNVTDGVAYTSKYLFDVIAKQLNVPPPNKKINLGIAKFVVKLFNINYDEFEFLASDRIIDISKIKKEIGFSPSRKLDKEGLEMIEDYLKIKNKIKV
ncbi:MAG: NAD(P)-dependent oxidoreductase [Candidatus Marsarchaeota archaeon]|nr:NAD(P)-dependent oxidoreductase [Candidatus Marsarchaeota archaeon]MCL5095061.1 NAD(P)-dependent oxidoreductase [Candidatus Marsarchaeota archaeon]